MSFQRVFKDPDSLLDYQVDWSQWLTKSSNDTINTVEWIVPTGITKTQDSLNDDKTIATIWLEGGTATTVYLITCRITTAADRIEDFSFQVKCVEK